MMRIALLPALLFVFFSPAARAENAIYDRVVQSGTIRCGYIVSPPNFARDEKTGAVSGLWADLMDEVAKQMGLKVEWARQTNAADAFDDLAARKFDALCTGVVMTPQRERQASFTIPLYYNVFYMVTRTDDKRFDKGADAANGEDVRILIPEGGASQFVAAQSFPKARMVMSPKTTTSEKRMTDLADGKADVILTTLPMYAQYQKDHPGKLKMISGRPVWSGRAGFAVPQGEFDWWQMLNSAVEALNGDGRTRNILARYGEGSHAFENQGDIR